MNREEARRPDGSSSSRQGSGRPDRAESEDEFEDQEAGNDGPGIRDNREEKVSDQEGREESRKPGHLQRRTEQLTLRTIDRM